MYAYEALLEFSGRRGHAVIVEFDKPWRFVFWDKAQYVGCVDLGRGVWFTSEWCETNSPNDLHCYEPIMDKRLRWSRVQILESGPARARVRWTYALCDMRYRIFHGNTRAEETYTIYPDGVAVREVVLWPGTENNHGGNANLWQVAEWILINAAGTSPLDFLQLPAPFTLRNGCGEVIYVPWPLPAQDFEPFCRHYPRVADWEMYVGQIHLKGVPNPFIIICKDQALFPYRLCNACKCDHPYFNLFPGRNLYNVYKHWPVTGMEDFIEWVPAGQDIGRVATHTSFMDVNYALRRSPRDYIPTPDPGTTWYLLVGAAEEGSDGSELEALARSYYTPACIEIHRDPGEPDELHRGRVLLEGYDFALRAYTLRKQGEDRISLTMRPRAPQINPVFLINGWSSPGVEVWVNGKPLSANGYQAQIHGNDLTVWIVGQFAEETNFVFKA
ncbi:MAG: hypothetical protein RML36_16970 [Anaerolineae bacterium]|nr:hypothetical protein [Anaerolineae bacterium]